MRPGLLGKSIVSSSPAACLTCWNFLSYRGLLENIRHDGNRSRKYYKVSYAAWKRAVCHGGFKGGLSKGVLLATAC